MQIMFFQYFYVIPKYDAKTNSNCNYNNNINIYF